MGEVTQIGLTVDNVTLEKTGNEIAIKDDGVTSAKIDDGTIVDADISASAGISASKVVGIPVISQIYVGSDLDYTVTGGGATNSLELTAIPTASLVGRNYLKLNFNYLVNASGTSSPSVNFKIESKEVGGSYSDSMAIKQIASDDNIKTQSFTWLHTLSAGEKTNGIQIKLTASSNANGDGSQAFTNIQIVEEII